MIVLYINKEKVRVISVSNMRTKAMSNRGDRANERILITPLIDILMALYTQKNKKVEPVFELKTERLKNKKAGWVYKRPFRPAWSRQVIRLNDTYINPL